ncbi:MAG: DUF695 domain-containing protein [Bacteroidota bacterium]
MEYEVNFPQPEFVTTEFSHEKHRGIARVNIALANLDHKFLFTWQLSLLLELKTTQDDGQPTSEDQKEISRYEKWLDEQLNPDDDRPNALFLSRVTWNKTVELVWRIHNPEEANEILQDIIEEKDYPFPFDYQIDPDEDWELADWHLKKR